MVISPGVSLLFHLLIIPPPPSKKVNIFLLSCTPSMLIMHWEVLFWEFPMDYLAATTLWDRYCCPSPLNRWKKLTRDVKTLTQVFRTSDVAESRPLTTVLYHLTLWFLHSILFSVLYTLAYTFSSILLDWVFGGKSVCLCSLQHLPLCLGYKCSGNVD